MLSSLYAQLLLSYRLPTSIPLIVLGLYGLGN